MRHRVPGYIATTTDRSAAWGFMDAAGKKHESVVEWCYEISEDCQHLLYLNDGCEFILKPYTVVEVIDVDLQALAEWPYTVQKTTCDNPHRIRLRVEPDPSLETMDLPIAPWR